MKTHAYLIAIVCFFIMSGCQKDNPLAGLPADAVLLATEGFSNPDGTKTQVIQDRVLWTDGDPVNLDGNPYTVTVSGGRAYVTGFTVPDNRPFLGFYPADINASQTSVTVPNHYESSYTADGFQILKLPMVAMAEANASCIWFRHVTAAVRVVIQNTTGSPVILDRVVVSSPVHQLSGSRGITVSLGGVAVSPQADTPAPSDMERCVAVKFSGNPVIPSDGSTNTEVQVPILPIATQTDGLTITLYTRTPGDSPTRYVFSATASNPALGRNIVMTARIRLIAGGSTVKTGYYSVSDTKKVIFSPGNLQYQASTGAWRFAQHQWDVVGNAAGNTTAEADGRASQTDWIDLFCWGTGSDPAALSANESSFSEWPASTGWHTLASTEWAYLLQARGDDVTPRYVKASIGGQHQGLILFPDNYIHPADGGTLTGLNTPGAGWTSFSLANWEAMEAAGAVFLPAAGYRDGTTVANVGSEGNYWSLTPYQTGAHRLLFSGNDFSAVNATARTLGYSVRLVKEM